MAPGRWQRSNLRTRDKRPRTRLAFRPSPTELLIGSTFILPDAATSTGRNAVMPGLPTHKTVATRAVSMAGVAHNGSLIRLCSVPFASRIFPSPATAFRGTLTR